MHWKDSFLRARATEEERSLTVSVIRREMESCARSHAAVSGVLRQRRSFCCCCCSSSSSSSSSSSFQQKNHKRTFERRANLTLEILFRMALRPGLNFGPTIVFEHRFVRNLWRFRWRVLVAARCYAWNCFHRAHITSCFDRT